MKMKTVLLPFVVVTMIMAGCKKNPPTPTPPAPTTAPTVKTVEAILMKADQNGAKISVSGKIVSTGGSDLTDHGFCVSQRPTPTVNDTVYKNSGFSPNYSGVIELTVNKTYYIRAYAKNKNGTSYGKALKVKADWLVKDYDGNIYHTLYLNKRWWMKEYLKVTHYNDGVPIPNVTDNTAWMNLTTGAYSDYNNDTSLVKVYGRLYNFYTIETGKLAPKG